jgi:sugar phosphate isomerase/epimerase
MMMKPQEGSTSAAASSRNAAGIQVGNQTAFSAAPMMAPFEYALANGFDAFEWFPDKKPSGAGWDELDLDADQCATIRKAAQDRAMRLSVHSRWTINPLVPESATLLCAQIQLAEELGAKVLVLHLYPEAGIPAYARAILPPLQAAAARGLDLAVENTVTTAPADFNQLFAELRTLNPAELPRLGMCLDIGHANLCAATRNDYLGFIDQLDPDIPIIHLHAHENWGDADSHLPLFTGPAARDTTGVRGFVDRMKKRRFHGSVILEQWPEPPSLLNQARDGLLRIWRGPSAPAAEAAIAGAQSKASVDSTDSNSRFEIP